MPTKAAVRSATPALPGPTRRSCARRLRRWTRPVRTRWKTWPARSSAESPRQIARGGDQLENREGGAAGAVGGAEGDGGGGELLLAVVGVRDRRGTGRRRRRQDGCRRRKYGLGLDWWRSGCVVAEVGRRRSAAPEVMAAVVGDRLGAGGD